VWIIPKEVVVGGRCSAASDVAGLVGAGDGTRLIGCGPTIAENGEAALSEFFLA
jgi:hypothetical protein